MDVTFGWGGHPVASRCSCSEVWLQERRSEQQAVRPSLFIREEMMLQPQPHIDLLISNGSFLGLEDVCEEGKKKAATTSWYKFPQMSSQPMPFLLPAPRGVDTEVLRH